MADETHAEKMKRVRALRVQQRVKALGQGVPWHFKLFAALVVVLFAVPLGYRAWLYRHNRTNGELAWSSYQTLRYESDATTGALRLLDPHAEGYPAYFDGSRWKPYGWFIHGEATLRNYDDIDHTTLQTVAELLDAEGTVLAKSRPSLINRVRSGGFDWVRTPPVKVTHAQLIAARTLRLRLLNPPAPKASPAQIAVNAMDVRITSDHASLGLPEPDLRAERDPAGGWRVRATLHVANDRAVAQPLRAFVQARVLDGAGATLTEGEVECGRMDQPLDWRGSLPLLVLTDATAANARSLHLHLAVR